MIPPEGWETDETADEPPITAAGATGISEKPSPEQRPPEEGLPTAAEPPAEPKAADPAPVEPPPVEPPSSPPETTEPTVDEPIAAEEPVSPDMLGGPSGAWVSPAELLWRKWLLIGGASVAGLVVVIGSWSMFFSSGRTKPPVAQPAEQTKDPSTEPKEQPSTTPTEQKASRLDRRWIPNATTALLHLEAARLTVRPPMEKLPDPFGSTWDRGIGTALRSLGVKLEAVERLTWAATDLKGLPGRSILVLRLKQGHDAGALRVVGEPAGLTFAGTECRQLSGRAWPHPFAIVDQSTIVSGHAKLLQHVDGRGNLKLKSPVIDGLIEVSAADADAMLLVDLKAASQAGWRLPGSLLDAWPAGKDAWHTVCDVPIGLGCTWNWTEKPQAAVALVCDGPTPAEQVRAAADLLVSEADVALTARITALSERLQAGELTAAAAMRYETLLKAALVGSRSARLETVDETVWVRTNLGGGLAMLVAAVVESRPTMEGDWLAAARSADEANHRRLVAGLSGHQKAEGHYPAAATGGALLPPETRLSWIAQMLPYYGHGDWHQQLKFGYDWNSTQNKSITRRPLPEVVNPALGAGTTQAGFPTTHYVGVTGVGPDAGRLEADDPRAGVFGFGRTTRPEDITDGASNTIAVLGVTGRLGAWAAGGEPTARALTQRPYINGPDGFGSGQPDGMVAGMADGSVRFFSKDIDPKVLEQLATIHGGESAMLPHIPPDVEKLPAKDPPDDETPDDETPDDETPDEMPEDEMPERRPPIRVDAAARLAGVLPEIRLTDTSLVDAVDLLASLSTAPISFDTEAMRRLGVTVRDPVSVDMADSSFEEILGKVAAERGLVPLIEDGQVVLTGPAADRETLRQLRYAIEDLTGNDPVDAAAFGNLVQTLVAPDSWQAAGGRGTVTPDGLSLQISQTAAIHYQIVVFCEKLRVARALPLRSRYDSRRFRLTPRTAEAADRLAKPITANFHEPVPLGRILTHIEDRSGIEVLLDHPSLYRAGISPKLPATLNIARQPVSVALDELLGPLGLAYRAIDASTIEVSTREAITAQLELEFYPITELLAKQQDAKALLEKIKSRVAQATWDDAGGPGVLHIDQKSGHLIVLQSQPVQAEIQRLLGELAQE